ncbi:hypothetical protein BGX26_009340, partial [Mortierella sp. AD094]
MKITTLTSLAVAIGLVASAPSTKKPMKDDLIHAFGEPQYMKTPVRDGSYANAVTPPSSSDSSEDKPRPAEVETSDVGSIYVWDFEAYSQPNFIGQRQRFNGDGCVNLHCSQVGSFKGKDDKDYIFYDGDDCYGAVVLRSQETNIGLIPQPFKPCSIRVQWQSNYNDTGVPPDDTDLVLYPQPWYKGTSSASFTGKQCHNLDGKPVMSYQGHEDWTYTFYNSQGCSGDPVERND